MIRSMSDAQIEAAEVARHGVGFDKEPWVNARGERFATFNEGADASDPFDKSGALRLDPRPSRIPSPDPKPFECSIDGFRANRDDWGWCDMHFRPRKWDSFTPDPKFVRSEANVILSAFRDGNSDGHSVSARLYLVTLTEQKKPGWWPDATSEQVDAARKVLSRLRDVMEATK